MKKLSENMYKIHMAVQYCAIIWFWFFMSMVVNPNYHITVDSVYELFAIITWVIGGIGAHVIVVYRNLPRVTKWTKRNFGFIKYYLFEAK